MLILRFAELLWRFERWQDQDMRERDRPVQKPVEEPSGGPSRFLESATMATQIAGMTHHTTNAKMITVRMSSFMAALPQ